MNDPKDVDRFEQAWAIITNFFPQAFLAIDSNKEQALHWRATDSTWALGMLERYKKQLEYGDQLDIEEQRGRRND